MALLVASGALAEDTEVRDADTIVVTGDRPDTQVYEDTPVETERVDRKQIESTAGTNAADVVGNMAGVRTQQRVQGEDAAVSIEGLPPEYTKILVNGQRYSGRLGEVDDLADVPISNAERIELMRGAQALRYGAEAGGGVINVITRGAPETGMSLDFDGGYGQDDRVLGSGTLGARLGTAGLTVTGTHRQIDGFDPIEQTDGVFTPAGGKDSRERSEDVYSSLRWPVLERLALRSDVGWRQEHERIVPVDDSDLGGTTTFERWLADSGFDFSVNDRMRVLGDLAWYRGDTDTSVGRSYHLDEDEWKLDLASDYTLETGPVAHIVAAGLSGQRDTLHVEEGAIPEAIDNSTLLVPDVDEAFEQLGLLVSSESDWPGVAKLMLGGRFQMHSRYASVFLPQAAVLIGPWYKTRLRLSYGQNQRTPSLQDLFQPPVPQLGGAYFLAGNPKLGPERSQSIRVGIESEPESRISLSTTLFLNLIRDQIRSVADGQIQTGTNVVPGLPPDSLVCIFDPNDPACFPTITPVYSTLFRKENLDKVRTRGLEAQVRLRPLEGVELGLAYTLMYTNVEAKGFEAVDQLPNEPRNTIDLRAQLTAPVTETILGVDARWRSTAYTEGSGTGLTSFSTGQKSDASWTVDLRVVQPIGTRFQVYADLYNATNNRIVDSYQVRGRTVFVGVRGALGWPGLFAGGSNP